MKTNYKAITDEFISWIIAGKLKTGDRLPPERDLSEQFSVSRTTIREAIKPLQQMGIFESRQGSGTFVTSLPEETIISSLPVVFALGKHSPMDLQWLRFGIESAACRCIIDNCPDEEIHSLDDFLAPELYMVDDMESMTNNDIAFHSTIVNLPKSPLLIYLYRTLEPLINSHIRNILFATMKQNEMDVVRKEHVGLIGALKKRSYSGVSDVLMKHLYLNESYLDEMGK
jgi:GntR family transcriptional repressor for pyruvate dehydrogenase complex